MSVLIYRTLKIYSTQLDVWLTVARYSEGTSIPKAKSVNQPFHTTAQCAFLYAGLNTYLALQVNVKENNRILRDEKWFDHTLEYSKGQSIFYVDR